MRREGLEPPSSEENWVTTSDASNYVLSTLDVTTIQFSSRDDGSRTHTQFNLDWLLGPARLPIPPHLVDLAR